MENETTKEDTIPEEVGIGFGNSKASEDQNRDCDSQTPTLGMLFDTELDAYNFYNRYAKSIGFSVRKNRLHRNSAGIVNRRDFCCSWEGHYKKKATPEKKRDERRSGCKAMLIIRLNDDKKYVVSVFVEEHNHALVNPENAFMLRSHRRLEATQKLDAYNFYNRYAKSIGFSVRKNRLHRNSAGIVNRRDFCCSWEGHYKKKATPEKKRDERRSGCKAMLIIRLNDDKKYVVSVFVEEHNHALVNPENAFMLRSHRRLEATQKSLVNNMSSAGIKTNNIISYLSTEAGGAENLNLIEADVYNFVSKTRTEFLKEGDAQCLLKFLTSKEEANKFFFYKLRVDEMNRLCGVFIADAKSRCDYSNFGDVICFDTTFKTNNYNMICAPIVGVNHHGQTTLFGCGLLDSETTKSLVWLFEIFMEAMGGKHPQVIFTDQAMAIANAIKHVFPNTDHRLCLWHIYLNASTNLSAVFAKFKEFAKELSTCIYKPETVEEFEAGWEYLLTKYELQENKWLGHLYGLKKKWAQVYARDHFCAAMTTTQRSESINNFLKNFFNGNLILREFVGQYDKALASRRMKERTADTDNKKSKPNLATQWAVELEASNIYTKKIFYLLQAQCVKCVVLKLELCKVDGENHYYNVRKLGKLNARIRSITYNTSKQLAKCSCRKFEFHGILCAHVLKLFLELEITSLPPFYYLKRWTMEATNNLVYDCHGDVIQADLDPLLSKRYSELSHCAQALIAKGAKTNKKRNLAISEMLRTLSLLDNLSDDDEEDITDDGNNSHVAVPSEDIVASQTSVALAIRNPISKKRAREPKTRKKHVLEKKTRRKKKTEISNITAKRTSSQNHALVENQPTRVIHNGNTPCIQGTITIDEPRPPIRKLDFVDS